MADGIGDFIIGVSVIGDANYSSRPSGYVRRGGDEYGDAFAALFPTGPAWPTDEESVFQRTIRGLAAIFGDVDGRAGDLLVRESDPRATIELLEDWERAFGLPDPCVAEPLTIADRRAALINRMTCEGGQSLDFFYSIAMALGYAISIREYSPFMCGLSRCGDTRPTGTSGEQYRWEIGPVEMRFVWRIMVSGIRIRWFRAGQSQVSVDPLCRIALATDLECVIRRWSPAHTEVVFDYSTASPLIG
jgi:uncharacterized protein YmfQ (DUF2313 family)